MKYADARSGLEQLGWPAETLAWAALLRDVVGFGIPSILLFLLVWRRANSWFLLFVALLFALYGGGAAGIPAEIVGESVPAVAWWSHIMGGLTWQFFFLLFFFFPDGRPVPGWTRWVAAAWGLVIVGQVLSPAFRSAQSGGPSVAVFVILVLTAIGSQVYRYARRSTPHQRQQTKWVVFVLALGALYIGIVAPIAFRAPVGPDYGRQLVFAVANWIVFGLVFQLMPIVIGISILRNKLWDIDLIIRRTLVYSAVTALLALVFYGSVILLQRLFAGVSGQQSPVALVVSTLAIAALFSPLRRRVQEFVDRRFYRRKYDAQAELARFATVARDETSLEGLSAALAETIDRTIQPDGVGIWLQGGKP